MKIITKKDYENSSSHNTAHTTTSGTSSLENNSQIVDNRKELLNRATFTTGSQTIAGNSYKKQDEYIDTKTRSTGEQVIIAPPVTLGQGLIADGLDSNNDHHKSLTAKAIHPPIVELKS